MKKVVILLVIVMVFGFIGCDDTRLLPSDMTETYYYQPDGSENYFTIDFTDDNNGTLEEIDPGDPYDPDFDFDDKTDDIIIATDPFNISGLDGTRHFTGANFSSDTGLTTGQVALYTFRTYGYVKFNANFIYKIPVSP